VLGDPIIRIKQIVKGTTLTAVVALRAQILLPASLAAQDKHPTTVIPHHRQRFQSDHLIDLGCPGVGDRKSVSVALLVFDHPKGRITDNHIDLGFRLIDQGIGLGQLAKATGLEFGPAIWI
jgi:hypothetical protein